MLFSVCCVALVFAENTGRRRKGGPVGKPVTFMGADGVILQGYHQPPASSTLTTYILLHGLGSNQEEWQPFVQELIKQGYGFLSYDARGHGDSVKTKSGKLVSYETFGMPRKGSEWGKMIDDLAAAIAFLREQKGVQEKKIGYIGASMGANVAFIYAAGQKITGPVILLSPGMNYAGFDIAGAVPVFAAGPKGRPIAIAAAADDTYAYQSTCLINKQLEKNTRAVFWQASDSSHGVNLLDKSMITRIFQWMRKNP